MLSSINVKRVNGWSSPELRKELEVKKGGVCSGFGMLRLLSWASASALFSTFWAGCLQSSFPSFLVHGENEAKSPAPVPPGCHFEELEVNFSANG